jgi:hypothetical protein
MYMLQASVQCRRLLDAMFSISKLDPMYVVSVKMFLKLLSKVWNEIPRKVSDVDKIDYFIDHFRATIYSLVSASLMPKHKMTWQLLLALQVTCECKSLTTKLPTGRSRPQRV